MQENQDAREDGTTTPVHGDVLFESGEGQEEVPVEEGGARVHAEGEVADPAGDQRTSRERSLANLVPYPKGVSGNPAGRPKGIVSLKTKLRRYLRDHPEDARTIVISLVEEAKTRPETIIEVSGNERTVRTVGGGWAQAQKLLWDRHDGLLTQTTKVSGTIVHTKRYVDEDTPEIAEDSP